MHVHGHTKTRMFWDTKTHVHRKPERTCIMGHKCLKRHRRTRSRVILSGREKEAGPRRGGERGPAYGPALGGEAGAVLIGSLSAKGSRIDTGGRIGHRSRITARALMRLQPIELQHMPQGLRRAYA